MFCTTTIDIIMGRKVYEECMWLTEGYREICITYFYNSGSGQLTYAASIFKKPTNDYVMTDVDIKAHEHTTTRRYTFRPANVVTFTHLGYDNLIHEIRDCMINGPGCKGPKLNLDASDSDSYSDSDETDCGSERCETPENTQYTDLENIKKEVLEAKKTFQKYKWPLIDVTRKSVEETAASIIKIHEIYLNNAR